MSKGDLIDALAASHRTRRWNMDVEPWDDLDDDVKEIWRREMRELCPLIVQFVADWIETQGQVECQILPIEASSLAGTWREDMA